MGEALFVYGTLIDDACVRAVTGRSFPRVPATLEGWERLAPPGGYPFIAPRAGARVDGFLLEGLDATALAALDRYEDEGRLYFRRAVEVTVDGRRRPCQTYVGDGTLLSR